jgi:hypothetical protein
MRSEAWAGKRVTKGEMCKENDKEVAGKDSRSELCIGAEHGQACTKDRTGAVMTCQGST